MNDEIAQTDPLAGLQQALQLPANVSFWPLAPFWWFMALLVAVFISWLVLFLCRKKGLQLFTGATNTSTQSLVQTTQRHLQQHYTQWQDDKVTSVYLERANVLLKRYVISSNSNNITPNQTNTRHLPNTWHGETWVKWLQQAAPTNLSLTTLKGLSDDCYRRESTLEPASVTEIHQQLQQWIADYDSRQHA